MRCSRRAWLPVFLLCLIVALPAQAQRGPNHTQVSPRDGGQPAQPPTFGVETLDAKLVQEGSRGPIYGAEDSRFARRDADKALSCASPCTFGTLADTRSPYFNVAVDCGNGAFTGRSGPGHPDGADLNIVYGGAGLNPGTSDITFHVHNNNTNYHHPRRTNNTIICLFISFFNSK